MDSGCLNVQEEFKAMHRADPESSVAIIAMKALYELIRKSNATTILGLTSSVREAVSEMQKLAVSRTSVKSGCELFYRFITFTALDQENFDLCRAALLQRGKLFLDRISHCRDRIADYFVPFMATSAPVFLVHSSSRVILQCLNSSWEQKKCFSVLVTQSAPDNEGEIMVKDLNSSGIPASLVLDAAVAYVMNRVDAVLVGAEGVTQSGGIVNKIGTLTVATCAKAAGKPVYVVAESFKLVQIYPFSQMDLPNELRTFDVHDGLTPRASVDQSFEVKDQQPTHILQPVVDYTPPELITLIFTDLGILGPNSVCEMLLKLYL